TYSKINRKAVIPVANPAILINEKSFLLIIFLRAILMVYLLIILTLV
ncbi:MAG: hypothetical protein H6Q23_867, partial [Bacteroidetes bacterium]|nr:hypothetical protein [Bacteroidota bacterium]